MGSGGWRREVLNRRKLQPRGQPPAKSGSTNCYSPVMMDATFDNYFWVFFVAIAAYIAYSLFTKRGKGRMFGGEIVETLLPTISKRRGMMRTNIKVHLIKPSDRPNERDIGIEVSHSAVLAWSMTPIILTAQEAAQLKELVDAALSSQS
jgi:hypothetical protein